MVQLALQKSYKIHAMIDRLTGKVITKSENSLTVMVGGVGLKVYVPRSVLTQSHDDWVDLYTHLVVREDAITLYGFGSETERQVFEALIKVNGVGPRMGLAVLSTLTVEHLRDAVGRENADMLTRVPGVGKKTAQKIVLELKDKIGWKLGMDAAPIVSDVDADVVDALLALGYSVVEAQSAVQAIPPKSPDDVEERIRLALEYFT
jgi:holliday junction DNA helicase RuvA